IGHTIVKANGPRCGCGAQGCMEALASKTAIQRRVNKAIQKGVPTVLRDKMARKGGRLKSGDLAEAVAAKDPVALKAVERAAHYLGLGLGGLVNVLGPEVVIIGGGVVNALGDPWIDSTRTAARTQIITDPDGHIKIVRAELGDDAGILGAALLAREHFVHS
ncbi:MAG: ROK family protein, partial [Isosphaeraceae bacterium]